MKKLKEFLSDFPNQNGGVVTALLLILLTGLVVIFRLARGWPFPDGYEGWLIFLGTLAGVSTVGMIGKRATDKEYAMAKRSPVTVQAASTVKVDNGGNGGNGGVPAATGAYPVQVVSGETDVDRAVPLPHRDSERGDEQ